MAARAHHLTDSVTSRQRSWRSAFYLALRFEKSWALLFGGIAGLLALNLGCSRIPSLQNEAPSSLSGLQLLDLDGHAITPLQTGGSNANVFVFINTDCPISNRYAPEIRRLHDEFAPQGVKFWLVYPNPTVSPEEIRRHLEDYHYPCEALRDPRHELVKQAQARVTPEAAVFVPGPKLVYHGRIDDRYVDFGKERPSPSQRDLHDVLRSVVAGKPVTNAPAPAVGCYLSSE